MAAHLAMIGAWLGRQSIAWIVGGMTLAVYLLLLGVLTWSHAATAWSHGQVLTRVDGDSFTYTAIADQIVTTGYFTSGESEDYRPNTFRTPGYPYLLVASKHITGSYFPVLLFQILLTALAAGMIAFVVTTYTGRTAAFWAGLLFAFNPLTIRYTFMLMTDLLFAVLVLTGLVAMFWGRSRWMVVGGWALWGVAVIVRPIGLYLPGVIAVLFILELINRRAQKKYFTGDTLVVVSRWRLHLIGLIIFTAIMVPWGIRNQIVSGSWSLTSVTQFNWVYYNIPDFYAYHNQTSRATTRAEVLQAVGLPERDLTDLSRKPVIDEYVHDFLSQHRASYVFFHLASGIPVFFSTASGDLVADFMGEPQSTVKKEKFSLLLLNLDWSGMAQRLQEKGWELVEYAWAIVMVVGAGIAAWQRRHNSRIIVMVGMIGYFFVLTGPVALARYRLPMLSFLIILFCLGVRDCYDQWLRRRLRALQASGDTMSHT